MKKILGLVCLFASVSAFSATVKITSFNYIRTGNVQSPIAELCGAVEGVTSAPTFVQVTVDQKTTRPGHYNTHAGTNGKFCMTVVTYRGTAEAELIGGEKTSAQVAE